MVANDPTKTARLFVLGAGFSAAAGIPLTDQLLPEAMAKFQEEAPGLFSRVDDQARRCFGLGDDPIDYRKVSLPELSTFLEYLELREHAGGERWSAFGSREKCALRYYLSKTIVQHTPTESRIPDLYLKFANQLRPWDRVVTFNWDCLVEAAIRQVGKKHFHLGYQDDRIGMLKLHGSVDWQLYQSGPHPLRYERLDPEEEGDLYSCSALWAYEHWAGRKCLSGVEPCIVLPGFGKAYDVRALALLWYKLEWTVALTYDTYIIGLSLAPDDFIIRSYFHDNFTYPVKRTDALRPRIRVINPGREIPDNYAFMLPNGMTEILQEEFSPGHVEEMEERFQSIAAAT